MIFKKKYIRSEWMEGLLEAEQLIKDGYDVGSVLDEPLWFTRHVDCIKQIVTIGYLYDGRKDGAVDYICHYHKNKLRGNE